MASQPIAQRHYEALCISDGACNISGMAHALVSACRECIDENVPSQTDPAVQLIVSQIAFIAGCWDGFSRSNKFDWTACRAVCRAEVESKKEIK